MNKTYITAHTFWLLLSAAVACESWRLGFGSFGTPGPGFVPFLAALTMGGLAVVALFQTILERSADNAEQIFSGRHVLKITLMFVVFIVYVLLWNVLGFLATTFLVLLYLYRAIEPMRWRTVFIATVVTLLATHVLFSTLLSVRLPTGWIWTYFMN